MKKCEWCKKWFDIPNYHNKQRFCSVFCSHQSIPKNMITTIESKIIKIYKSGMGMRQVSKIYRIGDGRCKQILLKHRIKSRELGRKYSINHEIFSKIDTKEKAYWLGFLLADGDVSKKTNKISLNLSSIDKNHLYKFKKFLSSNSPILDIKDRNISQFAVFSPKIKKSLIKLGITPQKSFTVEKPHISKKLESDFWRGCVDGDGSLFIKRDGFYGISLCGTYKLIKEFSIFVGKKLKIKCKEPRKEASIYKISWGGHELPAKVADLLYGDRPIVYLSRKKKIANIFINLLYKRRSDKCITNA